MSKNDAYRIRARISTIFAGRVSVVSDDLVLYNFTPTHARALAAELLAAAAQAEAGTMTAE